MEGEVGRAAEPSSCFSNEDPFPSTLSTLLSHPKSGLMAYEFIHQHLLSTYCMPSVVPEQTPTVCNAGQFPE